MADLPVVIGPSGLLPQQPASLLAQLLASVAAVRPGYTASLPGSLIEDISSTDVGALIICDSARVETVNSLTPFGANDFLLNQLGQLFGVPIGAPSNTSVFVVFSGTLGFAINKGFLVGDGNRQYQIQDGGSIASTGQSLPLFAICTQAGTFAVPAGTVTQLVTQPPETITLSVVNQVPGVPGTDAETASSYRATVLQASLAATTGMSSYLRTLLRNVPGVQKRLIAVQLREDQAGWKIIVGGGDPYLVAYAIYKAIFDISTLVGSELVISGITNANPGVVFTFLNHGFANGQLIAISDSDPTNYNGSYAVLNVVDEKTFSLGKPYVGAQITTLTRTGSGPYTVTVGFAAPHGVTAGSLITLVNCAPAAYNVVNKTVASVPTSSTLTFSLVADPGAQTALGQLLAGIANFDTSGLPSWVIGGVLTPNLRNITVTIIDYPDNYPITFVNPPQQTVTANVQWNTNSPNFVSPAAVAQLGAPAINDYINSVYVGQPMNLLQMETAFRDAIASVLPPNFLSRLVINVSINGIGTAPDSGTFLIEGDPESYFFSTVDGISVVQS